MGARRGRRDYPDRIDANLSARRGSWLVDEWLPKVDRDRWAALHQRQADADAIVGSVRSAISEAAAAAIGRPVAMQKARENADADRQMVEQLRSIQGLVDRVSLFDHSDLEDQMAFLSLLRILRAADGEIDQFCALHVLPPAPAPARNTDVIGGEFLRRVGGIYTELFRRPTSKASNSDLIAFMAASWLDVGFPEPVDRSGDPKPLEDTIAERLRQSDLNDIAMQADSGILFL